MAAEFIEIHDYTGTMAYPPGPVLPPGNQAHASTYVCDGELCQAQASEWVESITGQPGVFEPFGTNTSTEEQE